MNNQEQSDVELETVERIYWVEQLEALERLEKNPDFKAVILDGYLDKKALDSVSLLAVPAVKKSGERTDIMEDLVAISNLKYHFQMLYSLGSVAREDLDDELGPVTEG